MVKLLIFLITSALSLLCNQIDIGTDLDRMGNVVKSGVVQQGWTMKDASYKSSPPQSEIYFYVKGLDLLGPTFEVTEFHHDDETHGNWLFMNVTVDEKISGILKDYTAYKVDQVCVDREGGSTIRMSITMKAITCEPITFAWNKVCGEPTATKEGLNVGLSKTSAEVVSNGVVTAEFDGNTKVNVFKVPNEEISTKFYMYHDDPFMKTFFNDPYIITDHEVMYPVITRDQPFSTSIGSEIIEFEIKYNCLVSDGIKEELILVIELPYFHDLEIHFFKTCGIKKESMFNLEKIFFVIGIVVIGLSIGYAYNQFQNGEDIIDLKNITKSIGDCGIYWKECVGKVWKRGDKEDFAENTPDDDGKNGLNVHTMYGTI